MLSVPGGTIWGPSALKLWRPDAPLPASSSILIAKPGHHRNQYRIQVRDIRVDPSQRGAVRGIALQSAVAAFVDSLAALPDESAANALFGWASARELVTPDSFAEVVETRAGARNVRRLRAFVRVLRAGAGSAAEFELHLLMTRHSITGWEANAQLKLPDGTLVRVDLLFRSQRLAIEVDGWGAHGSKTAFQKDRARQNALIGAGYRVLRFTWDDIMERGQYCVDQIINALASGPEPAKRR
jgi:very-short-patch-repair endonuclease